ncbi:hypothetical protein QYF36_020766 [Acer negundo]|nr:hypothetical protein QYF36_020766 [Acer negundo]
MAKRHYDHELQFNQAADASSELDQVSLRLKRMKLAHTSSELDQVSLRLKRTKLAHDMVVSLPQDIVGVITEMVAMDTHEKDLMLPNMSKFLWWYRLKPKFLWNIPNYSFFPAFEFPSHIFQPNWFEAGLVAVQKIDRTENQYIRQLPAVVRYLMSKYSNRSRYCTVRSPEKINEDQDSERWENYWSNPLKARVSRVEAFVRELEKVVQRSEEFWIFFNGRIVVTLPKKWVYCENEDKSTLGYQGCKGLLRRFQEIPETLNLLQEVRTQLSIASRS